MEPRSKKFIVSAAAIFGSALVVATGVALMPTIREHWYVGKLERGPDSERALAVEWLKKNGSDRAARRLLRVAHRLSALPQADAGDSDASACLVRVGQALEQIAMRERRRIVPLLTATLRVEPLRPGQPNQVRIGAANILKALREDAREAVPTLTNALGEDDERFHEYVSSALEEIRGGGR